MKAYILSVAGIILLSAVVTVIAPSGKMGKFVKGTMKLFILVVMISPFVGWLKKGELPLSSPDAITEDGAYLSACADLLESRDEEEISMYLTEKYSVSASVDVTRAKTSLFPLEKISVVLQNQGIYGEDERIHMVSQIREELQSRYGVETEVA